MEEDAYQCRMAREIGGNSWLWVPKSGRKRFLWAHQVHSGQQLIFFKAKAFEQLWDVCRLGDLDGLSPGSRVTFRWVKDQ